MKTEFEHLFLNELAICTSFSVNCLCSHLLPTFLLSWLSFASLVWAATFGNGGHWPFSAAGVNCVCWEHESSWAAPFHFPPCLMLCPAYSRGSVSQAVLGKGLNKGAEFVRSLMEVGEFWNVLKKRGTQDWGLGWAKLCKHQPER